MSFATSANPAPRYLASKANYLKFGIKINQATLETPDIPFGISGSSLSQAGLPHLLGWANLQPPFAGTG
jgi:hypothetical protein